MPQQIVISFFDYTGNMLRPWAERGYLCYAYDIQHEGLRIEHVGKGSIYYIGADLSADSDMIKHLIEFFNDLQTRGVSDVKMVFGFPPCTDLAVSGARHFEAKRAVNFNFQQDATDMATSVADFAEAIDAPYMIENPVSVLSTLWRKPDHTFHPFEYGGYLPNDDVHPEWPDYIAPRDAYPKKTCLWTSPNFNMPNKAIVEPEGRYSRQFKKLGGKSMKTKNIRNATPRGFAEAVCIANAA